jgi:hypothetical protein
MLSFRVLKSISACFQSFPSWTISNTNK